MCGVAEVRESLVPEEVRQGLSHLLSLLLKFSPTLGLLLSTPLQVISGSAPEGTRVSAPTHPREAAEVHCC